MKRIQRYIAMGASLLIACLLTVAGVLAAGSITTTITVDIQYDGDVQANIYVATYSNDLNGPYFKDIDTTVETFNTTSNVATIYDDNNGKYQENTQNKNTFTGYESAFIFADDGYLKFFFLIENLNTTGSLTYTIGLSFDDGESGKPAGTFAVTDETSEMKDVFLLNKQGDSPTKSLCTIVFKADQGTEQIEAEGITITIKLTQADARPLDFEFEFEDDDNDPENGIKFENSLIRMASTSANTASAYYKGEDVTEEDFGTGSALIFNGTDQPDNITPFAAGDNFRFKISEDESGNKEGKLILYLLFENDDANNELTYLISLTYEGEKYTLNDDDSSDLNVLMDKKMGATTKSLCKLVFELTASGDENAMYYEPIKIKIDLSRPVDPVEFNFELEGGSSFTDSVIRFATSVDLGDEAEASDITGDNSALVFNGTAQTATITTLIGNKIFTFDENGDLILYLLFENSDTINKLTYTITLTYGDNLGTPTYFTFNSTDSSVLTAVIGESTGTATKSLCKLVFESENPYVLYKETINIKIELSKTAVE